MKELYKVWYMTERDYDNYMMGGHNYILYEEVVEAESAEEAKAIAAKMFPDYVIDYAKSLVAIERDYAEYSARLDAEKEKRAARKKANEEFAKAHPEIVAERKRKAAITRAKNAIKKAEAAIAEAEEERAFWMAKLAELE